MPKQILVGFLQGKARAVLPSALRERGNKEVARSCSTVLELHASTTDFDLAALAPVAQFEWTPSETHLPAKGACVLLTGTGPIKSPTRVFARARCRALR